jgi:hypothetical protein
MTTITDSRGGDVAIVSCGSNHRRYDCWAGETVKEVVLRRLPENGRREGNTPASRAIWRGLNSAGTSVAFATSPCKCGHRREVHQWLTDEPVANVF